MLLTPYYGLKKPEGTDTVNIADLNSNADAIDVQLNNLNTGKAPLASPTFTGAPAAPTASAGTNTTQLATTAFVTTAVANKTSVTGNAGTATKLATARTIALNGDVTGSVVFDGSADASITAVVADDSHNHIIGNVDGLQSALDTINTNKIELKKLNNVDCNTLCTFGEFIIENLFNGTIANAAQNASLNYPSEDGYINLTIKPNLANGVNNGISYIATVRNSGHIFIKNSLNNSFSSWKQIATVDQINADNNINTCMLASNDIQVIANNVATRKALQVVGVDGNGMATTGTSPRITIKQEGWYLITGFTIFTGNVTGTRTVCVYKNGNSSYGSTQPGNEGTFNTLMSTSYMTYCYVGDYFELYVQQNCGGGLNCFSSNLWVRRLG